MVVWSKPSMPKTADLLEEIAALKAMLLDADARDRRKDERIARLEKLVAAFKQAVFGRKSEKSDPDQFELALEVEPLSASGPRTMARGNRHSGDPCRRAQRVTKRSGGSFCRKRRRSGRQAPRQTARRQSWVTAQAPVARQRICVQTVRGAAHRRGHRAGQPDLRLRWLPAMAADPDHPGRADVRCA